MGATDAHPKVWRDVVILLPGDGSRLGFHRQDISYAVVSNSAETHIGDSQIEKIHISAAA